MFAGNKLLHEKEQARRRKHHLSRVRAARSGGSGGGSNPRAGAALRRPVGGGRRRSAGRVPAAPSRTELEDDDGWEDEDEDEEGADGEAGWAPPEEPYDEGEEEREDGSAALRRGAARVGGGGDDDDRAGFARAESPWAGLRLPAANPLLALDMLAGPRAEQMRAATKTLSSTLGERKRAEKAKAKHAAAATIQAAFRRRLAAPGRPGPGPGPAAARAERAAAPHRAQQQLDSLAAALAVGALTVDQYEDAVRALDAAGPSVAEGPVVDDPAAPLPDADERSGGGATPGDGGVDPAAEETHQGSRALFFEFWESQEDRMVGLLKRMGDEIDAEVLRTTLRHLAEELSFPAFELERLCAAVGVAGAGKISLDAFISRMRQAKLAEQAEQDGQRAQGGQGEHSAPPKSASDEIEQASAQVSRWESPVESTRAEAAEPPSAAPAQHEYGRGGNMSQPSPTSEIESKLAMLSEALSIGAIDAEEYRSAREALESLLDEESTSGGAEHSDSLSHSYDVDDASFSDSSLSGSLDREEDARDDTYRSDEGGSPVSLALGFEEEAEMDDRPRVGRRRNRRSRRSQPVGHTNALNASEPDIEQLHAAVKQLQIECPSAEDFRVGVHQLAGHLGDLLADGVVQVDFRHSKFEANLGKYPASRDCLRASGFRRERHAYVYPQRVGHPWPAPWPQEGTNDEEFAQESGNSAHAEATAQSMMRLLVQAMKSGTTPPLSRVRPPVLDWNAATARGPNKPRAQHGGERPDSPGVMVAKQASATRLAQLARPRPSAANGAGPVREDAGAAGTRAASAPRRSKMTSSRLHSLSRPRGEAAVPDWANREVRGPAHAARRRQRGRGGSGAAPGRERERGGGRAAAAAGGTFAQFLQSHQDREEPEPNSGRGAATPTEASVRGQPDGDVFVPPALRPEPAESTPDEREKDVQEAKAEYLQWLARNPA